MKAARFLMFVAALVATSVAMAGQEWGLMVLNTQADEGVMSLVNQPNRGPKLLKGMVAGDISPAKPRSFLIYVWKGQGPHAAYAVSTSGGRSAASLEEVTGKVPSPKLSDKSLGEPRVYRVPVGSTGIGEVKFDLAKITGATMLVCAEDHNTVYPPDGQGEKKQGLWIMPNQFAAIADHGGVKGNIFPFASSQ